MKYIIWLTTMVAKLLKYVKMTYTNPVNGSIVRHGVTLLHASEVSQVKRCSQFLSPKYSGSPYWKITNKKHINTQ